MTLWIFVEGETEKGLVPLIRCWLSQKLGAEKAQSVGVKPIPLNGTNYWKDIPQQVLAIKRRGKPITALLGLIDFWRPPLPEKQLLHTNDPERFFEYAQGLFQDHVHEPQFRQHVAVYETEAWLLSQPDIFPPQIRAQISKWTRPEEVNGTKKPSARLGDLYRTLPGGKRYDKALHGPALLQKLDPAIAYAKCPFLARFLDDILESVQNPLRPA